MKYLLLMIIASSILFSQEIISTSPKNGSQFAMPNQVIVIRFDTQAPKSIKANLSDENSEVIPSNLIYTNDENVINIRSQRLFEAGEKIKYRLEYGGISKEFSFTVADYVESQKNTFFPDDLYSNNKGNNNHLLEEKPSMPEIEIEIYGEQADGYYFIAPFDADGSPWDVTPDMIDSRIIVDNYGTVIYWQAGIDENGIEYRSMDWKIVSDSIFSHFELFRNYTIIKDKKMQIIDTLYLIQTQTPDFYIFNDVHDFQTRKNGNYTMMSYPVINYDLSQHYEWGNTEIQLMGSHVQELDQERNVIWEWNGFEHTNCDEIPEGFLANYDNSTTFIDLIHMNSFEYDTDTSIVFSQRNLNEVCRVNTNNNEYFWRIGNKKYSDLNFTNTIDNDIAVFQTQHSAKLRNENILTLFDNAPNLQYSRGIEYKLDFEEGTADIKYIYREDDRPVFGQVMGNLENLSNGNKVIGFGSGSAGAEYDSLGNIISFIDFVGLSYRVFKYDITPEYFLTNKESLDFSYLASEAMLSNTFLVKNNMDEELVLTGFNLNNPELFKFDDKFPITLEAGEELQMVVEIDPTEDGTFEDVLTVFSDTDLRRYSFQVELNANIDIFASVEEKSNDDYLQVSPNPANDIINLNANGIESGIYRLKIIDINGQTHIDRQLEFITGDFKAKYNINDLPSGSYIISMVSEKNSYQNKFIVK